MQKILLFALVGLGLGAPTIHADGGVDCHSLSKWDRSKAYSEDELVWAENQDWHSDGAEYKCAPRGSKCSIQVEPKNESEWKVVGNCKSGTKPN
ncbi:MAG TPA: hypothetical protein VGG28_00780 [Kofleriaceae bacterium]|jgi:hypothetical protein